MPSLETLIESISQKLKRHSLKLCTAESCTGGMVSAACTSVAGSSDWFNGAVVSYSNEMKINILGVSPDVIAEHGAVSIPCAESMALGALKACGADCAVSLTGIAGPGGGSEGKPVGTVIIGLALPFEYANEAERTKMAEAGARIVGSGKPLVRADAHLFTGDRGDVREAARLAALWMLDEALAD